MGAFHLVSEFQPRGDQPQAIAGLVEGVNTGQEHQVLLGVTGSGKTFTMANVIAAVDRPALVIAHNKTLAAQLYGEFKTLFPENAVAYFVSYYDYYQPEAYIPSTDTYIEKDSAINEEIDKLRHAATHYLLERRDVIIVASVSCIYGLGSPEAYHGMLLLLEEGMEIPRDAILARLVEIQYERNDIDFHRGTFRVRGDVVEIFPPYEEERAIRVELFGDTVEAISVVDPLRGKKIERLRRTAVYPGSHYVTTQDNLKQAIAEIREELGERLRELNAENKLLEAQRLEQRTHFDIEMMEEMGYCSGIENYSRHLTGRETGRAASDTDGILPEGCPHLHRREPCDRFPSSSRCTGATGRGRRPSSTMASAFPPPSTTGRSVSRSSTAFRNQRIYVSATPAAYELGRAAGRSWSRSSGRRA